MNLFLFSILGFVVCTTAASTAAQNNSAPLPDQIFLEPLPAVSTFGERDRQHDFDFEIGTWKTQLKRLLRPLTGSTTWVEYEGTTVVRKVWNGRANLVELVADGPAGHFEGLSLRLYDPLFRQVCLNFSGFVSGSMISLTVGR